MDTTDNLKTTEITNDTKLEKCKHENCIQRGE